MSEVEPREILTVDDLPENVLIPEAAQFFRISELICRRWVRDGHFPNAWKSGRAYIIPRQDVLDHAQKLYGRR
ncbi:MAG: helix-turn-helix domain-containing protein [Nocardioidaceae bacterium]|nr:helix-turn-helix domain-containing protein [Nocardioidaceae bacterium]